MCLSACARAPSSPETWEASARSARASLKRSSEGRALAERGQRTLFDAIALSNTPFIAAIGGFALGGGLELALACHVRIASDNARMGLPEVTLGLIPGYGGTQRLSRIIGHGRAMEMILSARMVKAAEALGCGLVSASVPRLPPRSAGR